MKNMIEVLASIKGQGAMLFAGAVFVYVVVGWWFGHDAIGFVVLVQMAVLSMICAGWQYVCFVVDKKHRFVERVIGFFLIMYLLLLGVAYLFNWFTFTVTALLIFTGLFIFFSAVMFCTYGAYFRITGTRYNQMLTAYKERNG